MSVLCAECAVDAVGEVWAMGAVGACSVSFGCIVCSVCKCSLCSMYSVCSVYIVCSAACSVQCVQCVVTDLSLMNTIVLSCTATPHDLSATVRRLLSSFRVYASWHSAESEHNSYDGGKKHLRCV